MLVAKRPRTVISRGPLFEGTTRRQTLPSDGQEGSAGSSSVMVASARSTSVLRLTLARGVRALATSPRGGGAGNSARAVRDRTRRSLSGDPGAPRSPAWISTERRAGTFRVTPDVGSSEASAPPAPKPSQTLG